MSNEQSEIERLVDEYGNARAKEARSHDVHLANDWYDKAEAARTALLNAIHEREPVGYAGLVIVDRQPDSQGGTWPVPRIVWNEGHGPRGWYAIVKGHLDLTDQVVSFEPAVVPMGERSESDA